jgi:hypothetical protein
MPLAETGCSPTADITLIVINIIAAPPRIGVAGYTFPRKKHRTFTTQFAHSLIV